MPITARGQGKAPAYTIWYYGMRTPLCNSVQMKISVKSVRNPSFLTRLVYAICLAAATYNHARIVAVHGINWNYGGMPAFVCVFWTALTFIDALAVIMLMTKPRYGLALTTAIIVCDVVINGWVGVNYGLDTASFLAQVVFLIFVLSTVSKAWRAESASPRP